MDVVCPCCGGALPDEGERFNAETNTLIGPAYAVKFTTQRARLFAILWRHRANGRVVSAASMFDELYAMDPNGGPDPKIIEVMISKIRIALQSSDFELMNIYGAGFYLRKRSNKTGRGGKNALEKHVNVGA